MMDTLSVALRVAEEAIEEAISKTETYSDSLVKKNWQHSLSWSLLHLTNFSIAHPKFAGKWSERYQFNLPHSITEKHCNVIFFTKNYCSNISFRPFRLSCTMNTALSIYFQCILAFFANRFCHFIPVTNCIKVGLRCIKVGLRCSSPASPLSF